MDEIDRKILEAINTISPKSFISPVKVNEILRLDPTELGNRLKTLKKSGHVGIMTSEYPSSLTLPNSISICVNLLILNHCKPVTNKAKSRQHFYSSRQEFLG